MKKKLEEELDIKINIKLTLFQNNYNIFYIKLPSKILNLIGILSKPKDYMVKN